MLQIRLFHSPMIIITMTRTTPTNISHICSRNNTHIKCTANQITANTKQKSASNQRDLKQFYIGTTAPLMVAGPQYFICCMFTQYSHTDKYKIQMMKGQTGFWNLGYFVQIRVLNMQNVGFRIGFTHKQGSPNEMGHFSFLLVTTECIDKIKWFLASINYINNKRHGANF